MEKYNFVGKNLTDKDKDEVSSQLDADAQVRILKTFTERSVTAQEKETLQTAFNLVSGEMKRLGVSKDAWSTPEMAHFFDKSVGDFRGFYSMNLRQFAILKPKKLESVISATHGFILNILYGEQMNIMESVVGRIAEMEHKPKEEVWDLYKKEQFTGNLMHLRKVEDVYGEGSLRILGEMPAYWEEDGKIKKLMKKFFVNKDLSVREELLEAIQDEHNLREKILAEQLSKQEHHSL